MTRKENHKYSLNVCKLEQYILTHIPDGSLRISCKQLNDNAVNDGINTSKEKDIRTLLYFLTVKGYTRKKEDEVHNMEISRLADMELTIKRFERRLEVSRFAIEWLYRLTADTVKGNKAVQFSVVELLNQIKSTPQSFFSGFDNLQLEDVEEALLYLSKIGALKLEGGFLVLYNTMNIQRIKDNNRDIDRMTTGCLMNSTSRRFSKFILWVNMLI